jgi:hypothetical protein
MKEGPNPHPDPAVNQHPDAQHRKSGECVRPALKRTDQPGPVVPVRLLRR